MQQSTQHTHLPRIRYRLPLLLLLLLLFACRNDVDSEAIANRSKVFADFFVRYLASERQLRAQVSFWDGFSWEVQEPMEPSGIVSFENRRMTSRRLSDGQIRFSDTFNGDYDEKLAFRFRNRDGRYLQYELKMTPVRDFFVQGEISKGEGATFVVNGGVMNKGESLLFMFLNGRNEATPVTFNGPHADVAIRLGPEQLQSLSPGPGKLYLVKKQQRSESHSQLELSAAVEYYSEIRDIEVLP